MLIFLSKEFCNDIKVGSGFDIVGKIIYNSICNKKMDKFILRKFYRNCNTSNKKQIVL